MAVAAAPKMKVVNMYSVGPTRYIIVRCPKCGMRFGHKEENIQVKCPRVGCGNFDTLSNLRDRFSVSDLEPSCKTIEGASSFAKKWSQIEWMPRA